MKQYIDKSALVAEIKRRINNLDKLGNRLYIKTDFPEQYRLIHGYESVLSFIDTLEVKEVDLEKEIDKFYGIYRKNGRTYSIEDNEECLDWKVDCNPDFVIAFAKHFFELGLKTQKEE